MRLLTIESIKLFDKNNNIKYEQKNIKNTLHQTGQFYMLNSLFANKNTRVDFYYAGLDNRTSLSTTDTMASLLDEPSSNGYIRQKITSWSSPVISNSVYVVKSNSITFSASSTGWGPVRNIFLATTQNNSGFLISSVKLNQELILKAGDTSVLIMNLSLSN
jgi:hypothetical protein